MFKKNILIISIYFLSFNYFYAEEKISWNLNSSNINLEEFNSKFKIGVELYFSLNKKFKSYSFIFYNKSDFKPVFSVSKDHNDKIINYNIYDYDDERRLLYEYIYNNQGIKEGEIKYIYNDDGKEKELLIKLKNFTERVKFNYLKDKENKKIIEKNYYFGNSINNSNLKYSKQINYNISNNKKQSERYYTVYQGVLSKSVNWYSEYIYDKNELLQSILQRDNKDQFISHISYKYDKNDNIVNIIFYKRLNRFDHASLSYNPVFLINKKISINYKELIKITSLLDNFDELSKAIVDKSNPSKEVVIQEENIKELANNQVNWKDIHIKPKKQVFPTWVMMMDADFSSDIISVKDSNIIFGLKNNNLISIDKDGFLNWKKELNGNVIVDPIANLDNEDAIYVATNSNTIYAVNSISGEIIWQKSGFKTFTASQFYLFKNWLVGVSDNIIFMIDVRTGNLLWERAFDDSIIYSPIGNGAYIYVVSDNQIYKLNLGDGIEEAKLLYDEDMISQPRLVKDNLILFMKERVICINSNNFNDLKWRIVGEVITESLVKDNYLYILSSLGDLIKINPSAGSIIWQGSSEGENLFNLSNTNYYLMFVTDKGYILSIDYGNGGEIKRYQLSDNSPLDTSIISTEEGRTIYYGTKNRKLYKAKNVN